MSVAVKVFDWILRVLGLLVLLGLITAFAGWVVAPSSDTRPPKIEEITDLQSFGDGNWETFRIDIDDLAYYSVRTGYEGIRASGPCEHYFDRNGNYIATNGDIGNDVQPWLLHPQTKRESEYWCLCPSLNQSQNKTRLDNPLPDPCRNDLPNFNP